MVIATQSEVVSVLSAHMEATTLRGDSAVTGAIVRSAETLLIRVVAADG